MSMPHRLMLKEQVHALKWDALCFWEEEVNEHDRQEHKRRKEEVHPVVHLGKHLWCEAGDEEVPQPIGRCSEGLGQRTHIWIEHFLSGRLVVI